MKNQMKEFLADTVKPFRLPRYTDLEQTTQYINNYLAPLGCIEITGSMISNYVKKGLIANPVKKQYTADQIAHIICIALLKNVLSLEHISELFQRYRSLYTAEVAYNYFCMELENLLYFQFGLTDSVAEIGSSNSTVKEMLRSAIIAVSHIIYLDRCFVALSEIN